MSVISRAHRWPAAAWSNAQCITASQLPAVDGYHLTNPLYASAGVQVNGLLWYWQHNVVSEPLRWVALTADAVSVHVAFTADPIGLDTPAMQWRDYTEATRLLAWCAQHEPLIDLMRAVFQRDWMPQGFCDTAEAPADAVQAGFTVCRTDGLCVTHGLARFDPRLLAPQPARRQPRWPCALEHARAELPIVIDYFDVTPAQLHAISSGCVIRLDNRTLPGATARVAVRAGRTQWVGSASDTSMRIVAVAASDFAEASHPNGEHVMNEIVTPVPETPTRDSGVHADTLPVRLTFHAGRLTLPFGAVRDVAPGYVFELNKRLDAQAITVHANDTPIAVGELVCIGDLVGVRITRMLVP
jgi:flagellar motor switch/type III secretory pathway protein FliN